MKTFHLSLLVAAFALAGTQTAAAQTGTFCFDGDAGGQYLFTLTVNSNATDLIVGTVELGSPSDPWVSTGGRGQSNATLRHHVINQINPALAADPGCTDGAGFVDWFTYNGNVTGNSFPYFYSGDWVNACGSTGTFDGFISPGACPPLLQGESSPAGAAMMSTSSEARQAAAVAEALGVSIHPNPATNEARISYTLSDATDVRVVVYDMLGRKVATLVDGTQDAGTHTAVFDARGLASGTYVYQLVAGKELTSGQLTLTR